MIRFGRYRLSVPASTEIHRTGAVGISMAKPPHLPNTVGCLIGFAAAGCGVGSLVGTAVGHHLYPSAAPGSEPHTPRRRIETANLPQSRTSLPPQPEPVHSRARFAKSKIKCFLGKPPSPGGGCLPPTLHLESPRQNQPAPRLHQSPPNWRWGLARTRQASPSPFMGRGCPKGRG